MEVLQCGAPAGQFRGIGAVGIRLQAIASIIFIAQLIPSFALACSSLSLVGGDNILSNNSARLPDPAGDDNGAPGVALGSSLQGLPVPTGGCLLASDCLSVLLGQGTQFSDCHAGHFSQGDGTSGGSGVYYPSSSDHPPSAGGAVMATGCR